MLDKSHRPDQDEAALLAFEAATASGQDNKMALRAAIDQFPACAALLADHALMRSLEAEEQTASTTALEAHVLDRADALLTARLAIASAAPRELVGLLSAIKQQGIDAAAFARSAAVGMSVLVKLDRRLLDISTVPRSLVESLAASLEVATGDIWRYLANPPTLSPSASYNARQTPELSGAKPQSFTTAIATAVKAGELARADADRWRQAGPLGPSGGE